MHTIKKDCRLLVENILKENFTDANDLLRKILLEAEEDREENAQQLVEGGEDAASEQQDAEASPEASDTDLDDAGDVALGDDLEGAQKDKTGGEEGAEMADEGGEEEMQPDDATLTELGDLEIKVQCDVNKKMISIDFDRLANLKTAINTQGLDKRSREYVTLDTKISYYSAKLKELQDKCVVIHSEKLRERRKLLLAVHGADARKLS